MSGAVGSLDKGRAVTGSCPTVGSPCLGHGFTMADRSAHQAILLGAKLGVVHVIAFRLPPGRTSYTRSGGGYIFAFGPCGSSGAYPRGLWTVGPGRCHITSVYP
jgi:hypothetical protein